MRERGTERANFIMKALFVLIYGVSWSGGRAPCTLEVRYKCT